MVDFESYITYGPGIVTIGSLRPMTTSDPCSCSYCVTPDQRRWRDNFNKKPENGQFVADDLEDYQLLPPRVLGYALNERAWAQLSVERVKDCRDHKLELTYNNELIFPEGRNDPSKGHLKNLVEYHARREGTSKGNMLMDSVKGKGMGLVILLHG
jgi:hypothetical protein